VKPIKEGKGCAATLLFSLKSRRRKVPPEETPTGEKKSLGLHRGGVEDRYCTKKIIEQKAGRKPGRTIRKKRRRQQDRGQNPKQCESNEVKMPFDKPTKRTKKRTQG